MPAPDDSDTADLSVVVVREGATPVRRATVRVEIAGRVIAEALSDEAGQALLASLPRTPVDVVALADGLVSARGEVDLRRSDPCELRLVLSAGAAIRGRVVDAGSGRPLAAHRVRARRGGTIDRSGESIFEVIDDDAPVLAESRTDERGEFELSLPRGAVVTLETSEPHWSQVDLSVRTPDEGAVDRVELRVLAAASLEGRIMRSGAASSEVDEPVVVFAVPRRLLPMLDEPTVRYDVPETWAREQIGAMRAVAGADGAYALHHLVPGTDYCVVALQGDVAASRIVEQVRAPAAGASERLDLKLDALVPFAFAIELPKGVPQDGLDVAMQPLDGGRTEGAVHVREGGRCQVGAALPGRYVVRLSGRGFPPHSSEVQVTEGAAGIVVRVPAGLELSGVVVDEAGGPIADVVVAAVQDADDAGPREGTWRTAKDGAFRIAGLQTGPTDVYVRGGRHAFAPLRTTPPARGLRIVGSAFGSIRFSVVTHGTLIGDVIEVRARPRDAARLESVWVPARRAAGGGEFVAEGFPPGDWDLTLVSPGAAAVRCKATVAPGRETRLDVVELAVGVVHRGRVLDSRGLPVVGARILPFERADLAVSSDPEGSFLLAGLSAPTTTLTVEARGFPRQAFGVWPGNLEAADLVLVRGGTLRGEVVGPEGARGAQVVRLHVPALLGRGTHDTRVVTDERGRFEAHLLPEKWTVSVIRGDSVVAERVVDVEDETTAEVQIDLITDRPR